MRRGSKLFGRKFTQALTKGILQAHGFNAQAALRDQEKAFSSLVLTDVALSREKVCQMGEELNRGQAKEKRIDLCELQETFEDPSAVKANISLDEVGGKKQKASGRKRGSPPKGKREMVYNTLAPIQNHEAKTSTLNTSTVSHMRSIVLAFLLSNGLLSQPGSLVFFTDGARDLRSAIQDRFRFLPFKIILDWFHPRGAQRAVTSRQQALGLL